ncbi:methyltransferase type 11 [Pseudogulbenkiania sp. NH8B]|uniref:methyltransferase domain-containing protein n=1 Tax=Pseudogulbenkiania sp. (strain NH8B) TaxID=748280 RepID=UPI000227945B|nr:methyltransferase domain-containing protein [Pseudogulbenkiania sp. NH8B]BAK75320.1 methyltransferase type 11 [Pseudogulbenkiania sp. NH8B]
MLDKNTFDAALRPGVRASLAGANQALRRAEAETFGRLLDERGDFLPGASFRRDCPQCGTAHERAAVLLRAHGMQLVRCPECRLVYSREVIDRDFERQRYQDSSASQANLELKHDPFYAALERDKAAYVAGRLSELAGPGRLLDIGSSSGALLRAAEEAGWQSFGMEINPAAVQACRSAGLSAVCGEYPCALPEEWGPFDAIALLDVLEHVADPLAFLDRVSQDLKPGGWLVVQVPNFSSFLLTIEGVHNNNICHGHWSYFEPATLPALLVRAGFEMRWFETYISELDRVLAYPDEQVAAAWEQLTGQTLAEPRDLQVEQLHTRMLGYKLFGLFQKVAT